MSGGILGDFGNHDAAAASEQTPVIGLGMSLPILTTTKSPIEAPDYETFRAYCADLWRAGKWTDFTLPDEDRPATLH